MPARLKTVARTLGSAGLLLALLQGPALAQRPRPPMPPGYDDAGAEPQDPLPKIVRSLRTILKDPYSIRDFTLCASEKLPPYFGLAWVPSRWSTKITLNSKNSFGGYTGSTMFSVEFAHGEVAKITQFRGLDLVGPDVNARLLALAQSCPRIPDAEIQRLLAE